MRPIFNVHVFISEYACWAGCGDKLKYQPAAGLWGLWTEWSCDQMWPGADVMWGGGRFRRGWGCRARARSRAPGSSRRAPPMERSPSTSANETLSTTSHMSIPLMVKSKPGDDNDNDNHNGGNINDNDGGSGDFEADVELSQCPTWTMGTRWSTKLHHWSLKHCQRNY